MREFEEKLLARRREYSILRVDRADLSKNVLRGFTGFDIFLEQHPEFSERITFTAQLMPSRTDVPEYAEYLERIEALVAVVNHRHGTPDWMPINLKLRDDLAEAVASYKHYDVMMVNAMFDGMNLVAKEGPLVNERDGVSILSENTGAHEELGEFALSVNPFDVQELADSIYAALTMSGEERARRAQGLKEIVTSRDPGDWIDEQIADIRKKAPGVGRRPEGLSRAASAASVAASARCRRSRTTYARRDRPLGAGLARGGIEPRAPRRGGGEPACDREPARRAPPPARRHVAACGRLRRAAPRHPAAPRARPGPLRAPRARRRGRSRRLPRRDAGSPCPPAHPAGRAAGRRRRASRPARPRRPARPAPGSPAAATRPRARRARDRPEARPTLPQRTRPRMPRVGGAAGRSPPRC